MTLLKWEKVRAAVHAKATQFLKIQDTALSLLHDHPIPSDRKSCIRHLAELQLISEELVLRPFESQLAVQVSELRGELQVRIDEVKKKIEAIYAQEHDGSPELETLAEEERLKLGKKIPPCPLSNALVGQLKDLMPENLFSDFCELSETGVAESQSSDPIQEIDSSNCLSHSILAGFATASKDCRSLRTVGINSLRLAKLHTAEAQVMLIDTKGAVEQQAQLVRRKLKSREQISEKLYAQVEGGSLEVDQCLSELELIEQRLEDLLAGAKTVSKILENLEISPRLLNPVQVKPTGWDADEIDAEFKKLMAREPRVVDSPSSSESESVEVCAGRRFIPEPCSSRSSSSSRFIGAQEFPGSDSESSDCSLPRIIASLVLEELSPMPSIADPLGVEPGNLSASRDSIATLDHLGISYDPEFQENSMLLEPTLFSSDAVNSLNRPEYVVRLREQHVYKRHCDSGDSEQLNATQQFPWPPDYNNN